MATGDHIRVRRRGYWHHGIDCGDGTVIHYSGTPWVSGSGRVERVTVDVFAEGLPVEIVSHESEADAEAVMARALARMGEDRYHVVFNNCEHFASWCKTGRPRSAQVRKAVRIAAQACVSALVIVGARHAIRRRRQRA